MRKEQLVVSQIKIKNVYKMVLRRSDSTRTTFSVYVTRKTKYQRYLGILNVLMLLGSLTMIFSGLVLKLSYYMDHLGYITSLFAYV